MPDLFAFFSQFTSPLFFLKVVFLIVFFLYGILTLVIFNQVKVMGRVAREVHSSAIIEAIALFNLLAAISLFLYALVIL